MIYLKFELYVNQFSKLEFSLILDSWKNIEINKRIILLCRKKPIHNDVH